VTSPILLTSHLTRAFGEMKAVDDLQLEIAPGEVFGLLGPNGAGKSTSIKMLTTLLPPTAGTATIAGYDIVRQQALDRQPILAPQIVVDASLELRQCFRRGHLIACLSALPRA